MWLVKYFIISSFLFVDYIEIPVKVYNEEIELKDIRLHDSVIYYFSEGFDSKIIVKSGDTTLLEKYVSTESNSIHESFILDLKQYENLDSISILVPSKQVKFSLRINKVYKYVDLYLYKNFCISTYHNSRTISE